MKIQNNSHSLAVPFAGPFVGQAQVSRGDLVSAVDLLVEGQNGLISEAGLRAMAAARDAENRLAELTQRVAELECLALTDELTGLLNRRGFLMELNHGLATARRYDEQGVLLYIDLDGFKPINDTYGHAAGDEVLRRVGRLLHDGVRDSDSVGRLGGDEFALLLVRSSWEDGLRRAEAVDRLLNSACVGWEGRMIAIRASVGIQAYGSNDDGGDLLARADGAMYRTKRMRADVGIREMRP